MLVVETINLKKLVKVEIRQENLQTLIIKVVESKQARNSWLIFFGLGKIEMMR